MLDTECCLRQIGDYIKAYYVGFAMRKGHPLFHQLATAMRKLMDDGSIAQILHSYPELSGQCRARGMAPFSKHTHQLSVTELRGLFVLVSVMLAMALIWEVLASGYRKLLIKFHTNDTQPFTKTNQ